MVRSSLAAIWTAAWLLLLPAVAEAASPPLRWSAPVLVDSAVPHAGAPGMESVSCPSISLCVGLNDLGHVLTSTAPATPGTWKVARLGHELIPGGVSCPSSVFCLALDDGQVLSSTNPAGGAAAWRATALRLLDPTALSCPSATLCVGVGLTGDVSSSTNPTGGASAWHTVHADTAESAIGPAALSSVSCPSVALCVAVDDSGNVLSSTTPTAGARAWRRVHLVADAPDARISCPTVSFCLAVDGLDAPTVLSSSQPTGGRAAWHLSNVDALAPADSIACPSVSLCAVGTIFGVAATSANPTAGPRAWTVSSIDSSNDINAISCPTISLCVAMDASGNVMVGAPRPPAVSVPRIRLRAPAELEQLIARPNGHGQQVDSGLTIACPPHGRACTVTGEAGANDETSASNLLARISETVQAGRQRKLMFSLTPHGMRLLKNSHGFIDNCILRVVARVDHGAAVANTLLYSLAIPSQALPGFSARRAAGSAADGPFVLVPRGFVAGGKHRHAARESRDRRRCRALDGPPADHDGGANRAPSAVCRLRQQHRKT
jgi:hypothetical protein